MPKDAERDKTGGTPFQKELVSMDTIFETLQKTASRLNETADSANELIRTANERLGAMGAGVAFASDKWVLREERFTHYDEGRDREEDAGYSAYVLSYAKIHGTWQLGVQKQRYMPGTGNIVGDYNLAGSEDEPLLSADRELRIEAASMLPDFLGEYTAHLAKLADRLSQPKQKN
jgi:hypothetical protein